MKVTFSKENYFPLYSSYIILNRQTSYYFITTIIDILMKNIFHQNKRNLNTNAKWPCNGDEQVASNGTYYLKFWWAALDGSTTRHFLTKY